MYTVVIQWYVAEVAGYSEIVANPPRFLRQKRASVQVFIRFTFGNTLHFAKLFDGKTFLILLRIGVIFIRKQ